MAAFVVSFVAAAAWGTLPVCQAVRNWAAIALTWAAGTGPVGTFDFSSAVEALVEPSSAAAPPPYSP